MKPHTFDVALAVLQDFVAREGHARVPRAHREKGFLLGRWVGNQRKAFRRGVLPLAEQRRLEELPGWQWSIRSVGPVLTFENAARLLQEYEHAHGHLRIPRELVVEGWHLGQWVQNQRALHRRGKLCEEGVQILERLPGWTWDPRQDDFDHGLELLRRFVQRQGTARVSFDQVEDGFALGRWVRKRRQLHAEGRRHAERDRLLEALPEWTWDPYAYQFDKGLAMLAAFVRREGYAQVRASHVERGFPLGKWVAKRRQEYRAGKLAQERAAQLAAFPGWLWSLPPGPKPRKNVIAADPLETTSSSAR